MKKIFQLLILPFLTVLLLGACEEKGIETFIVGPETADCVGVMPQKCLMIKRENRSEWEFWYSPIEDFDYEPGYEYEIKVKKEEIENPAVDRPSFQYKIVKIIRKTKI